MKAISSGCGLTMSMPASWPHRLPCTVKIEPSNATRSRRRRTSSAASTSTMLIKGIGSSEVRHEAARLGGSGDALVVVDRGVYAQATDDADAGHVGQLRFQTSTSSGR